MAGLGESWGYASILVALAFGCGKSYDGKRWRLVGRHDQYWISCFSRLDVELDSRLCFGSLVFAIAMVERGLYPYALFFQTVPIVAIAPLIILWVGHGFLGVMTVALILSIFPIIAGATLGLTRLPKSWQELFQLNDANRIQTLRYLQIPHSLPYVWSGLRVSCGLSVIGAIVGEFSAGYGGESYGLGYLILFSSGQMKTDLLFASILASTLLGWGLFSLIDRGGEALLNAYHMKDKRMDA